MTRVLIAEDEQRISSFIDKGLRSQGYSTLIVDNGFDAATIARDDHFDLAILDLGLPGQDGLQALAEIRRRGNRLPVIILTARDAISDRVAGLAEGADDYITNPFSFDELLARIRVRLRDTGSADVTTLTAGEVTLDLRTRRVSIGNTSVELRSP